MCVLSVDPDSRPSVTEVEDRLTTLLQQVEEEDWKHSILITIHVCPPFILHTSYLFSIIRFMFSHLLYSSAKNVILIRYWFIELGWHHFSQRQTKYLYQWAFETAHKKVIIYNFLLCSLKELSASLSLLVSLCLTSDECILIFLRVSNSSGRPGRVENRAGVWYTQGGGEVRRLATNWRDY